MRDVIRTVLLCVHVLFYKLISCHFLFTFSVNCLNLLCFSSCGRFSVPSQLFLLPFPELPPICLYTFRHGVTRIQHATLMSRLISIVFVLPFSVADYFGFLNSCPLLKIMRNSFEGSWFKLGQGSPVPNSYLFLNVLKVFHNHIHG